MLASVFALGAVSAEDDIKDLDSYTAKLSFDTIFYNGGYAAAGVHAAAIYVDAGGAAGAKFEETNREFDNAGFAIRNIGLRGWIGFDQPIKSFGYFANGVAQTGFFREDFMSDADASAVRAAGGDNALRFRIDIPVGIYSGTTTFVPFAQLADGTIVKFVSETTAKNLTFTCKNGEVSQKSGATEYNAYSGKKAMSYDYVVWNYAQLNDPNQVVNTESPEFAYNKIRTFLNADGVIDQVNFAGYMMKFWGWFAADQAIVKVGYAIDDEAFFNGMSYLDPGPEAGIVKHLKDNLGFTEEEANYSRRYTVTLPFINYTGTHNVGVAVELADGTVLVLNDTVIPVSGAEESEVTTEYVTDTDDTPETNTPTGDVSMAMFAVIVVLAAGAVVLMKRRAF